ncbi:sigma-70 family RNA polymerase sigma factor [Rubritalea tangerina]|uniref:Sigma-70 family RNA polymerase sigma factor n=2 Tax=Rubritalea tangerina TaxID=430798 RepID=A0ABW4Z7A6_9BACT
MGLFSPGNDDEVVTQIAAHQAEILAYIQSLLPGDASVKDVLQRTNLVLWKKRGSYERGTKFLSWAFSVAYWEVRAFLKERKRKGWLVVDDELAKKVSTTMGEVAEEDGSMYELKGALELCLQQLAPKELDLINQRYYDDASIEELSQVTGRPLGSLRVSLYRIRASLKRCIDAKISMGGGV